MDEVSFRSTYNNTSNHLTPYDLKVIWTIKANALVVPHGLNERIFIVTYILRKFNLYNGLKQTGIFKIAYFVYCNSLK